MNKVKRTKWFKIFLKQLFISMVSLTPAAFLMDCNYVSSKGLVNSMLKFPEKTTELNGISKPTKKVTTEKPDTLLNTPPVLGNKILLPLGSGKVCISIPPEFPENEANQLEKIINKIQEDSKRSYSNCCREKVFNSKCGHFMQCSCTKSFWPRWRSYDQENESFYSPMSNNSIEVNGFELEAGLYDENDDLNTRNWKRTHLKNRLQKFLSRCSSTRCQCKNSSKCVKITLCIGGTACLTFSLMCFLRQTGYIDPDISLSCLLQNGTGKITDALKPYADVTLINFDCGNCCQHCNMECKDSKICTDVFSCCSLKCEAKLPKCVIM